MFDVALTSAGAQVVLATSSDENHPPENIIDGDQDTFWSTTGLYPQEFVITFASLMKINKISIECFNVNQLCIERSVQNEPRDYEELSDEGLEATEGQLQKKEITPNSSVTAQHLRFIIRKGYDHFCSVHKVHVDGTAVHG